jgi:hypothetical protein
VVQGSDRFPIADWSNGLQRMALEAKLPNANATSPLESRQDDLSRKAREQGCVGRQGRPLASAGSGKDLRESTRDICTMVDTQ